MNRSAQPDADCDTLSRGRWRRRRGTTTCGTRPAAAATIGCRRICRCSSGIQCARGRAAIVARGFARPQSRPNDTRRRGYEKEALGVRRVAGRDDAARRAGAMAAITVTSIDPSSGRRAQRSSARSPAASTFHLTWPSTGPPTRRRSSPWTTGSASSFRRHGRRLRHGDVGARLVRPAGRRPAVWYTLKASQKRSVFIIDFTDRASLSHAFQVVPAISSLSPYISTTRADDLTLTVNGGSFVASSPASRAPACAGTGRRSRPRSTRRRG